MPFKTGRTKTTKKTLFSACTKVSCRQLVLQASFFLFVQNSEKQKSLHTEPTWTQKNPAGVPWETRSSPGYCGDDILPLTSPPAALSSCYPPTTVQAPLRMDRTGRQSGKVSLTCGNVDIGYLAFSHKGVLSIVWFRSNFFQN